jgi:ribosomal protein S18 acetylase RimI-like enzyme
MNDNNKTKVHIAPLQTNELQELADLAARTFADTYGSDLGEEALRNAIVRSRSVAYFKHALLTETILVAKEEGQMIGYAQYGKVTIPEVSHGVDARELDRLYVDPLMQGRGIGHMLVDAVLADPLMAGASKIYLQVWPKNTRAIAFYKRYGFSTAGVTRFVLADGSFSEDIIMVRTRTE